MLSAQKHFAGSGKSDENLSFEAETGLCPHAATHLSPTSRNDELAEFGVLRRLGVPWPNTLPAIARRPVAADG